MSKSLKNILFAIAGLIGLLILIAVVLILFMDAGVFKSRFEKAASEALGMELLVGGRVGITFFPELHVRLDDVLIRNEGIEVAAAKEAVLEIALLPLLERKSGSAESS